MDKPVDGGDCSVDPPCDNLSHTMHRRLSALVSLARAALVREELPPPPPRETAVPHRGALLRTVLAREALPEDPVPPRPAHARPSLVHLLFAPEPLPLDPPAPPRRRSRWLAWLLRPERLDEP